MPDGVRLLLVALLGIALLRSGLAPWEDDSPAARQGAAGEPPALEESGAADTGPANAETGLSSPAQDPSVPTERLEALERVVERFERRAEVGVAVAPLGRGPVRSFGGLREGRAWSAIKVPLATAVLREGVESPSGRLLERAIRRSSNEAAKALYIRLGGGEQFVDEVARGYLQRTFDASGARISLTEQRSAEGRTETGTTVWRLEQAVRFYRQLARGCLLPAEQTASLLELMAQPIERYRWGALTVSPDPVAAKGGWGPDAADITVSSTWLVEQLSIIGAEGEGYVLGTMVRAPTSGVGAEAEPKREFETFPPLRDGAQLSSELSAALLEQLGPAAEWPAPQRGTAC